MIAEVTTGAQSKNETDLRAVMIAQRTCHFYVAASANGWRVSQIERGVDIGGARP